MTVIGNGVSYPDLPSVLILKGTPSRKMTTSQWWENPRLTMESIDHEPWDNKKTMNKIAVKGGVNDSMGIDSEMLLSSTMHIELIFTYYVLGFIFLGWAVSFLESPRTGFIFSVLGVAVVGHWLWVAQNFISRHRAGKLNNIEARRYVQAMEFNSFMMGLLWCYMSIFVMPHASLILWGAYLVAVWAHMAIIGSGLSLVGFCYFIHAALSALSVVTAGVAVWGRRSGIPEVPAFLMLAGCVLIIYSLRRDSRSVTRGFIESREVAKKLVQELGRAKAQAEKAAAIKDQFLSGIGHEIRNPMQSIFWTLELFKDSQEHDQDKVNALSGAMAACRHLNEMLTQLLDTSSIKSGKRQNRPDTINVLEITNEILNTHRAIIRKKGISLRLHVTPYFSPWVMLDPSLFRIVLNNLIANAVKFTFKGEINVHLDCEVDLRNPSDQMQLLVIEVSDTGIGIPDEKKAHLFDGRTRGQNAIDMDVPGTGLGMGIVLETVETYFHGDIELHSEVNKGSSFKVRIPVFRAAPRSGASLTSNTKPRPRLRGRVLLVEDKPSILISGRVLIERMGLDCFVAKDGRQAVDIVLKEENFDVIMMDCHMPVMDGFEATRMIREIERQCDRARQVIIAVTADVSQEDRDHVLKSGMDFHLAKPYEIEAVYTMLSQFTQIDPELDVGQASMI